MVRLSLVLSLLAGAVLFSSCITNHYYGDIYAQASLVAVPWPTPRPPQIPITPTATPSK